MKPKICIYGTAEKFRNYMLAVEAAGGIPCFGAQAADCDALLLAGGNDFEPWRYGQPNIACTDPDPQRDAAEMELLDLFAGWKKPVLGICRGMQGTNIYFGGTLKQDIPGHKKVNESDRIHKAYSVRPADAPDFTREIYGPACFVNSAHHQCIDRLGDGLCITQRAPDGTPEAFFHETLPIWCVQWHPERMMNPVMDGAAANGLLLFQAFLKQI